LFGAFSPLNGHQFVLELPHCDSINFQIYLNEFAKENPDELKILVLDNGAFHKAKKLKIPDNMGLIFLPPYSPELNPAEKIWAKFKRDFTNKLFHTLDELRDYVCQLTNKLTEKEVISICSFDYIFLHNLWTIL
jgi:transposase